MIAQKREWPAIDPDVQLTDEQLGRWAKWALRMSQRQWYPHAILVLVDEVRRLRREAREREGQA